MCQVIHDDWCPLLRVMVERGPDPDARLQIILDPSERYEEAPCMS
jgi:hypothetical protein